MRESLTRRKEKKNSYEYDVNGQKLSQLRYFLNCAICKTSRTIAEDWIRGFAAIMFFVDCFRCKFRRSLNGFLQHFKMLSKPFLSLIMKKKTGS
jgi:hypothetical protein